MDQSSIVPEWQEFHNRSLIVDLHAHAAFKAWWLNRGKVRRLNRKIDDLASIREPSALEVGMYPFSYRTAFPLLNRGGVDVLMAVAYVPEIQLTSDIQALRFLVGLIGKPKLFQLRRTYFEVTRDQFDDLDRAIAEYNTFLTRHEKTQSDKYRPIEVVTNVNRLRELTDSDDPRRPIAMLRTVEGAHSLNGRMAGKSIDLDHEASGALRGIDGVQSTLQSITELPVVPLPSPTRFRPEADNLSEIRDEVLANLHTLFHDYSVASVILAHFYRNWVANPCFRFPESVLRLPTAQRQQILNSYDPTLGLNEIGYPVVEWMLEHGMLIDITHCTPACRADIYRMAEDRNGKGGVFASHVGVYELNPTVYNLEDWEIKWMADHGGVIGVLFMNYWLMPHEADLGLKFIARTMEHLYNAGGAGVISIGSDFDGFTDPPDDIVDAAMFPRLTRRLWAEFKNEMDRRYTPEEIGKFLGKNALDFILNRWGKKEG